MIAIALAGLLGTIHPICLPTSEGCEPPKFQQGGGNPGSTSYYDERLVLSPTNEFEYRRNGERVLSVDAGGLLTLDAPPCGTPEAKEWGVCTKWTIRPGATADRLWKGPGQ